MVEYYIVDEGAVSCLFARDGIETSGLLPETSLRLVPPHRGISNSRLRFLSSNSPSSCPLGRPSSILQTPWFPSIHYRFLRFIIALVLEIFQEAHACEGCARAWIVPGISLRLNFLERLGWIGCPYSAELPLGLPSVTVVNNFPSPPLPSLSRLSPFVTTSCRWVSVCP